MSVISLHTEDKTESTAVSEKSILVIGGGISGITTAVEAAEVGHAAVIIERNPYLGGRVAQLYRYFPKLCPSYCGLEINFRRIKQNPKVSFYTLSEIEKVSGSEGNFNVSIKVSPRYVNEKCTACGECAKACPVERSNEFNFGMDSTKAIYLPYSMSLPMRYVIDGRVCKGASCAKCAAACKYGAIDLEMKQKTVEMNAGSIVFATGWNPYDAAKIENLNFGKAKNVITNMMMERLSAPDGPTKGKILRPSDKKEVKAVAFVQCAGSRDENHLPYCSAVCCMASLKQAAYLRESAPDTRATIFYIDLRAPGKYEDFLRRLQQDANVSLVKGKVAKIEEDAGTGDVIVTVEDVLGGGKVRQRFDMAVLAAGMESSARKTAIPVDIKYEENGFISSNTQAAGMYAAGAAKRPNDVAASVQDATGTALKSIQSILRGK